MKNILSLQSNEPVTPEGSRVLALDDETADEVFDALSSTTTRRVLVSLYEEPQPASQLATRTDTTVQNIRYHLDKLVTAELVEVATTQYSEKGNEMDVYAPTDEALILCAGEDTLSTRLRNVVTRWVGSVSLAGVGAALIQRFAPTQPTPSPEPRISVMSVEPASPPPDPSPFMVLFEPGVLFFLGAVLTVTLFFVISLWR